MRCTRQGINKLCINSFPVGLLLLALVGNLVLVDDLAWSQQPADGQGSQAAANQSDQADGVNQDRARQAVADGEIMALHDILTHIHRRYKGRVLEVILKDREAGLHGWVYDIRLLAPGLRILHLRVDAGTGSILMVEGAVDNP